ncbi:MAG TPA: hypothetical protein VIG49_13090 [Acetobacteraceae bacterium]
MSRVRSHEPAFFELYSRGDLSADRIEDFVGRWHASDASEERPLAEFLGMTEDEYRVWLMDPNALPQILAARRAGRPLEDIIAEYVTGLQEAARSVDQAARHALGHWLTARSGH